MISRNSKQSLLSPQLCDLPLQGYLFPEQLDDLVVGLLQLALQLPLLPAARPLPPFLPAQRTQLLLQLSYLLSLIGQLSLEGSSVLVWGLVLERLVLELQLLDAEGRSLVVQLQPFQPFPALTHVSRAVFGLFLKLPAQGLERLPAVGLLGKQVAIEGLDLLEQPVLLDCPVLLDLPEALDFLPQPCSFLLRLGHGLPLVGKLLLEFEHFLLGLLEPEFVGLGLVGGEQRLALVVQLLVELGDFCLVELSLSVAARLKEFVLLGPLAVLAPLFFQLLVGLLELADVLAIQLFDLLPVRLQLLSRLPLKMFIFAAEERVIGLQLAHLGLPPQELRPQFLHLLPVGQFELVDDLEPDDICVVDHEEGVDPAQLLVLEGYHLLDLADLLLVLLADRLQFARSFQQLSLDPRAVGLFDPQRVLDLVDDLVGALQLPERVLVGQLLPAHLLLQELDLPHVLLEVVRERLHRDYSLQRIGLDNRSNKYKLLMYRDYQYEYMRRGMPRGYRNDRFPFYRPDKRKPAADPKRLVDPKEFSDVYENPLGNLMPLLEYFTLDGFKLERDPAESKPKRMDPQRMNERMMRQRSSRHYEFNEEEEVPQNTELVVAIRRQPKKSFEEYKSDFTRHLLNNKEGMNKSRKANLSFIETQFGVSMKGKDLLNSTLIEQRWERVEAIIGRKLQGVQEGFERRKGLIGRIRAYEEAAGRLLGKNKEFKLLKNLGKEEQSTIFAVLLYYLALPSQQALHRQMLSFDQNTRQVFRRLGGEEDELKRILDNLPYKESSFYWEKLIDCCREITQCEHPAALDRARIQQFQAEFAGVVTLETLKKLRAGEWLDNTITSAVIEYLKQIQGANNYHGDGNYRACLFTHSETAIFLNNQRDLGENYPSYEKLIFLVNHDNQHWFVIAAYKNRQEIVVYDSLNTSPAIHNDYCSRIANKLKAEYRRRGQTVDFKAENFFTTPSQANTSDCGVFSIVNLIWAFDNSDARSNRFSASIIPEMRHSLFLFLLYLGYCRQLQVVPRKDYFDILFRSSIYYRMQSQLYLKYAK